MLIMPLKGNRPLAMCVHVSVMWHLLPRCYFGSIWQLTFAMLHLLFVSEWLLLHLALTVSASSDEINVPSCMMTMV
jgi:hypothetical protein